MPCATSPYNNAGRLRHFKAYFGQNQFAFLITDNSLKVTDISAVRQAEATDTGDAQIFSDRAATNSPNSTAVGADFTH